MSETVILVVLGAALLHAVWNTSIKRVSGQYGVLWLGLWLGSLVSGLGAALAGAPLTGFEEGWPWVAATGIIHGVYFILLAVTYRFADMTIAYPVARGTGVALTALTARFWLREHVSALGWTGIVAVTFGILALAFHGRLAAARRSVRYAAAVGVSIAAFSVVDKVGVAHVSPAWLVACIFGLSALIITPHGLLYYRADIAKAAGSLKKYVAVFGLGSALNYFAILWAYQYAQASYVTALREFSVVIGCLLGFYVLREPITRMKVVGILAILSGLVCIRFA